MPIERNAANGGNFISEAGEYLAKVTEIKTGLSKSEKPMLTVTFQTGSDLSIRAYFVKGLNFHMKALESLKIACGLKVNNTADDLIGRECGILVEAQKPDDQGRVFMTIAGYGPAKAVNESVTTTTAPDDSIPF